jgi:hypothetical protein
METILKVCFHWGLLNGARMISNMLMSSSLPSLKLPYFTFNTKLYLCYVLLHLNIAEFRAPPIAFLSKSYAFY